MAHARLEVPSRREPLSFGETITYMGESLADLPLKVMYYKGERKVSVTELNPEKKKADSPAPVSTPAPIEELESHAEPEESVSDADALSSEKPRGNRNKGRGKNRP